MAICYYIISGKGGAVMTATAPYRITPVIRTVDELREEKKKLEKEHGSLEDLYLKNERYGRPYRSFFR